MGDLHEPANAMIECGSCGLGFPPTRKDGLYYEDDEHVCSDCGATNIISVEEDSDEDGNTAYVSHWRCKHGVSEDDPCERCDLSSDSERLVPGSGAVDKVR